MYLSGFHTMISKKIEDIVIIGSGLTGLALSNLLKKTNVKISLIDIKPKNYLDIISNDRYIVLSNTSKVILESIGLWNELSKFVTKIKNIHISKKNIFGSTIVKAYDENLDSLGYQISIKVLMETLYQNIESENNISFIQEANVFGIKNGKIIEINYMIQSKEKKIFSRSVIFSTGSKDDIENKIFLDKIQKDYNQNAIVCELVTNKSDSDTAYERFTDDGILGIIPRKANIWTLIYSTTNDETISIKKFNSSEYINYFQELIGGKCGLISEINNIKIYPLKMKYYKKFIKNNVCLLGDAAHTLHPIAAQSFNLSLRDCAFLADLIIKAEFTRKLDFFEIFIKYYDERTKEVNRLVRFTDFLASYIHGGGILKNNFIGILFMFMDINKSFRINLVRFLLGVNFSQSLISTLKD